MVEALRSRSALVSDLGPLDAKMFVEQVWRKADSVLFLHGRLHFHYPDGTRAPANSGAPSCLVAYGREAAQRLAECNLPGSLVGTWHSAPLTTSTTRSHP